VTHPETLNKTAGFSAKTMLQNLIPILAQAFVKFLNYLASFFPRYLESCLSDNQTCSELFIPTVLPAYRCIIQYRRKSPPDPQAFAGLD
jgi:hypothetical protein